MTGSEPTVELPATCPSCGATVRHNVPWCLQCYASLTVAPAQPEAVPPASPVPGEATSVPAAASDPGHVDRVAEQMLAELATTSKALPSWWSRLPTSSAAKVVWVGATIAVAALALVLVLAIVGLVL